MDERMFYRVGELGDVLGCSKSKAYALVASGAIPSVKIGGLLRVPREALERIAALAMKTSDSVSPERHAR
jgi:excisionase family DNA binding protein